MSTVICGNCHNANRDTARFCATCGSTITLVGVNQTGPTAVRSSKTGLLPSNTLLQGRYLVLKKIGQGGMGAVYQTQDIRLTGKFWAVKEMSASIVTDAAEMQRIVNDFQREAQILASLDHPNIPKVVDYFNEAGRYYLVMEYVTGDTLEALLEMRQQPFAEEEVRHWSTQLCDALAYLHTCSPAIVFRDLKPANIMLDQSGRIKLIDFGIVRLFKPDKKKDTTLLGTIGYAAPEQYKGQTTPRSDIYALGVTLHELLTLHDPTTAPLQKLPSVRQTNPNISKEMEQVVSRAVEHSPNKRWSSVREMQTQILGSGSLPNIGTGGIAIPSGHLKKNASTTKVKKRTSRPTTRLIMAAKQLSNEQLAMIVGGIVLAVVVGVWGLAPFIQTNYPMMWNNIPTFLLAGPLTYAAIRRRWVALAVHLPITIIFWLTLWTRMEYAMQGQPLVLSALLSGIALEIGIYYLPQNSTDQDTWQREMGLFAGLGVIAAFSFYLAMGTLAEGFGWFIINPLVWSMAAILGVIAWFVGDLVQEWLKARNIAVPGS